MNEKMVASELVKAAHEIMASEKGPIFKALNMRTSESHWNAIHGLEDALENAAHDYDVAASYSGGPGEAEAAAMRERAMNLKEALERFSMKVFADIVKREQAFVRKYGTPEEYAEQQRNEMFPI